MPKRIIHLENNVDLIIDEPQGISDSDRAMVLASTIMNEFKDRTTALSPISRSGNFDFKIGYSIAKIYYQYKANVVVSALQAYSSAIKYIEDNPQLFDAKLSQRAINVLKKAYQNEFGGSYEGATNENESGEFILNDSITPDIPELTPEYLSEVIIPYIKSVTELQKIIDSVKANTPKKVHIKEIRRNSPISVSLDGASEAIQLIKDTVVPWRRKHAETMARLLEQEKTLEIDAKKAEVIDKKILAREQANKLKLENEKLRLELEKEKFQLAVEMLNRISDSRLTQTEREIFIQKLLPLLDVVGLGRLEMSDK